MARVTVKAKEDQMFDMENQVRRKAGESFEVSSNYAARLEAEGQVEISATQAKKILPEERVSAQLAADDTGGDDVDITAKPQKSRGRK